MIFESKELQWQAKSNAKNALAAIKGLEARLEAIISSEQICVNYPVFLGKMSDKESIEYDTLGMLHISEETPTMLRRAAISIKQMNAIQRSEGESNQFDFK